MKISEVIVELEKIKSEHGDVETEVRVWDGEFYRSDYLDEVFTFKYDSDVNCMAVLSGRRLCK